MPRETENKAFAKFGKEARGIQRAYSQIVILELLVMLVEEIVIKLFNLRQRLLDVIYFSFVVIRCFMTTFLVQNYEFEELLYTLIPPTK